MPKDETEKEYDVAIRRAIAQGDNETAHELSIGLKQYRELYKVDPPRERKRDDDSNTRNTASIQQ